MATRYRGKVFVEGSLARAVHADHTRPLPTERVPEAVLALVERANVYLPSPLTDVLVLVPTRVDIALDLAVEEEVWSAWSHPFNDLLRTDRYDVLPVRDGGNPTPSTVAVKNTNGGLRAYRRDHRYKDVLTPTVRLEAVLNNHRLTSAWARDNGGCIRTVAVLTPDRAADLHRAMCAETGALATYAQLRSAADIVLDSPLSQALKGSVLGYLYAIELGRPLRRHPNTVRTYRTALADIGVEATLHPSTPASTRAVRLDWDLGFVLEREKECDLRLVRGTPRPA
jgi:hypothetical protein